ncbi:MAG: hypothetical protein ACOC0N_03235 [Chroococcales cyanobacterium]
MTDPRPTMPQDQALVNPEDTPQQVSPYTREVVSRNLPANTTAEVRNETMALFEAIQRKAQVEMHKMQTEAERASTTARDQYLEAVRNARSEVEKLNVFDTDRIEYTIKLMQMDAEKNWENLVKDFNEFGDRLQDAASAAWTALTEPRPNVERTIDESKQL